MAEGVDRRIKSSEKERIVDFDPLELRAPFFLRVSALAIDYLIVLAIPVLSLVLSYAWSDGGVNVSIGRTAWILGAIVFIANSLVLPMAAGRSVGKLAVGLTIVGMDGSRASIGGVLRRNLLGYLATLLTLGIGFLIAAVNRSGRALHDFTAGTIVISGRKKEL